MIDSLIKYCDQNKLCYKLGEPMSCHTSFKIGGAADIFITISAEKDLAPLVNSCKELNIPYFLIGKGSNLLVSDKGIRGAVISLGGLSEITVSGEEITAFAGATLSSLCKAALENGLSGLEFAYGIPGSVGGALFMNAGAYGGEIKDVAVSATALDNEGKIVTVNKEDMLLGYRKSVFKQNGMIILSLKMKLNKGEKSDIESKMEDFISRRKDKQPLEYPSAGSFFKRPEGYFAGALIEKNGLKGYKVGGAMISEKHAGFVINCGNATAKDVLTLGDEVKNAVLRADKVVLEREVIFVGEE